jgi:hypothetical protein
MKAKKSSRQDRSRDRRGETMRQGEGETLGHGEGPDGAEGEGLRARRRVQGGRRGGRLGRETLRLGEEETVRHGEGPDGAEGEGLRARRRVQGGRRGDRETLRQGAEHGGGVRARLSEAKPDRVRRAWGASESNEDTWRQGEAADLKLETWNLSGACETGEAKPAQRAGRRNFQPQEGGDD